MLKNANDYHLNECQTNKTSISYAATITSHTIRNEKSQTKRSIQHSFNQLKPLTYQMSWSKLE